MNRLVANDKRYEALSLVLKHDGLKLLVMIRLCPLPYSISNGAISTFPTVQPLMFAAATAAATPSKLFSRSLFALLRLFLGRKTYCGSKPLLRLVARLKLHPKRDMLTSKSLRALDSNIYWIPTCSHRKKWREDGHDH